MKLIPIEASLVCMAEVSTVSPSRFVASSLDSDPKGEKHLSKQ